ncbi:MFS transporter [Pseudonocardia acaciae]|uniref:MFS transporter n=1 Tax=Pseudonocardia acaciae TaxID=551276 RepID=UPI0012ECBB18|nr:MFS transporter [Pseudonocardia acaciae]
MTRTPAAIMSLSVAALLFEGYDINVYGAVVPYLLRRADWQLTPQFAGLIGSAAVVGMLVGSLVAGPLTDLVGRRRVYLTTVVCFSAGSALSAVASSPEFLLVSRVVVGLGLGGFIPVSLAMVLEYSPAARRTFATAMASAGIGVGGGLAALATIWVAPVAGYQGLFWLGVAPLVLIVPVALLRVPESVILLVSLGRVDDARAQIRRYRLPVELPAEPAAPAVATADTADTADTATAARPLASLFAPGQARATVVFWVTNILSLLLIFGALTWLPVLMIKAGYGITNALVFLAVFQAGALTASILGSLVADRREPRTVVLAGFGCAVVGLAGLAAHPPTALVYPLVMLMGAGANGAQNLLLAYIATFYPPHSRGSGLGLAVALGRLGGIAGPVVGGLLLAGGATAEQNFLVFAAAPLLALAALAFGPRIRA